MRNLILVLTCVCFAGVASAEKFPLVSTPTVPAARGQVDAKTSKNGNTQVKIKVEHLAPPENLVPARVGYLVWFQQRDGRPESQGRLRIDKKLKASFETTTPWKTFDIVVTAENDPTVKEPAGPEVLKATVSQ